MWDNYTSVNGEQMGPNCFAVLLNKLFIFHSNLTVESLCIHTGQKLSLIQTAACVPFSSVNIKYGEGAVFPADRTKSLLDPIVSVFFSIFAVFPA